MAKDPIIFACANPTPEIWPWEAKAAGAAIVATGRSDFPNHVNNSLCFPAIFRGILDVRASCITDEMCFAAAQAQGLAKVKLNYDQLLDRAQFMIASAQAATDVLMNENCIPPLPDD
jgi:malate dehydrogenase (oxaloacetate-decarboxylating)